MAAVRLVVGTYDGTVFGLEADTGDASDGKFRTVFAVDAHQRHVKVLAGSAAGFTASGGADGLLGLYDATAGTEFGQLYDHDGPVTALAFFGSSHMLSGGEDGRVCVFHTRGWKRETVLKGHKGTVESIAVHPSGRVALSVGRDSSLRMWNLIRGNLALTKRLTKPGCLVRWSARGSYYAVVSDAIEKSYVPECQLTLFNADGSVRRALVHPSRVVSLQFLSDRVAAVGCENGSVLLWDAGEDDDDRALLATIGGQHQGRVTAVDAATRVRTRPHSKGASGAALAAELPLLATASADGMVCLWELRARDEDDADEDDDEEEEDDEDGGQPPISADLVASVKSDVRITAMTAVATRPAAAVETAPAKGKAAKDKAAKGKAAKPAAKDAGKRRNAGGAKTTDAAPVELDAAAARRKKRKKREQARSKAKRKKRKDEFEVAPAVRDGKDFGKQ